MSDPNRRFFERQENDSDAMMQYDYLNFAGKLTKTVIDAVLKVVLIYPIVSLK